MHAVDRAIAELAGKQDNLVHRDQLEAIGRARMRTTTQDHEGTTVRDRLPLTSPTPAISDLAGPRGSDALVQLWRTVPGRGSLPAMK